VTNAEHPEGGIAEVITAGENALRELIMTILGGDPDWITHSGLTAERLASADGRRVEARKKKADTGVVDDRLLYYTELYDLETIITKQWERFAACLGDKATFTSDMKRLSVFRNDQMHGRELLPHEEAMARGICGEFRNRLTILRSQRGPDREYYARIEQVSDSFGSTAGGSGSKAGMIQTNMTLRPGESVTFRLAAWDPEGADGTWKVAILPASVQPAPFRDSEWTWTVGEDSVADSVFVQVDYISDRRYHRHSDHDDRVILIYRVVPPDL
jgi:hypothetical protein